MPKKWGLGLGFIGFDDAAINKAPTDIAWAGSHTVAEDTALGTQVGGLLTATDPESGLVTFTLTDDAGGLFSIGAGGNTIIVTGVLDYETATSHSITVRATDEELATYDESFTITVSDVSESVPSNPLPDDGVTDVDDAASFDVLPTATVVDAGVKIHGKKSANGSTGKFIYDFENFAVNTTFVMKYSADWSLLSNAGKNVFIGFGSREGNNFDLVGLRGDGATGIHKVRMNGSNPSGWNQLTGHTVNDGGAAANGDQDGINWIALSIRDDGAHYDFRTSADGATWSSEYSNQTLGSLSTLVGNDVDGIAAVFAGTDTGPFSFNVLDYHSVPAPTITSASTKSQAENATMAHALTANQTVTWSIVGGADQARLEISGSTLRWASNGTKDFETPNDADTNNTYIVTVRATNIFGSTTDQTITVTVTDVDDTAPTITSASTANNAENSVLAHALTANETVTWSIVGGADQARFEISGSTLRWASNGTKDFENPNDADTNNTYVVNVRATDTANNTTDQTITVTVTDVADDPLDPYTTNLIAAWSMGRRLLSTYGNGAFYAATGSLIDTLLNQSVNASRNLTSAVSARPSVATVGSLVAADFTGSPGTCTLTAGNNMSAYIFNNAGFIVWVGQLDTLANTQARLVHDDGQELMGLNVNTATSQAFAYNFDTNNDQTAQNSNTAITTGTPFVVTWRHESGNIFCSVNGGTENSVASGNTSALTGIFQVGDIGGSGFDGKLFELYVWSTPPSSGNRAAIIAQAKAYAGIP